MKETITDIGYWVNSTFYIFTGKKIFIIFCSLSSKESMHVFKL